MANDNEEDTDKSSERGDDGPNVEAGSLESAENYVATSPGTGRSRDGGSQAFTHAFAALLEWGKDNSLIRDRSEFACFRRLPDAAGNEHEVWFDEDSARWLKATYPNRFGRGWFDEQTASAREYLTRLVLANRYFFDDIRLVALVNWDQRLRVLTPQPHIAGEAAPYDEIQEWFAEFGFVCLQSSDRLAWYRREDNLLVADAHEGNVIKNAVGTLVPIDLNIIQPTGELLEWVLQHPDLP